MCEWAQISFEKNVTKQMNIHMKNVNDVNFDANLLIDMCIKVCIMYIFIYIKWHIVYKYVYIYSMCTAYGHHLCRSI